MCLVYGNHGNKTKASLAVELRQKKKSFLKGKPNCMHKRSKELQSRPSNVAQILGTHTKQFRGGVMFFCFFWLAGPEFEFV